MARIEVVIQPNPRGAQRTLDMSYPANLLYAVGTTSIGNSWVTRQGTVLYNMGTVTGIGAPPAGSGYTTYRGRIAHKQTASAGTGGFYKTDIGQWIIHFPQTKDAFAASGLFQDDFRCWRITLIAAYDTSGGILLTGDGGLEIGPGAFNYDIIVGATDGIGIRPTSNTTIGAIARKGGVLGINQNIATGLDVADWNAYEIRIVGATPQTDAVVKWYVNGQQKFQASYGAGTLLPTLVSGVSCGWSVGVGNRATAAAAFTAVSGMRISAAATEAGLL